MKRMIVFSTAFVIACFILAHIDRKSGAESMSAGYDTSILKTLDCLDCEVYYDPYFEDYKILDIDTIIKQNGLILVESWPDEERIIELYEGKEGGFLAILRDDNDKLYCAQYINPMVFDSLEQLIHNGQNVYFHEIETIGSGVYYMVKGAFFLDGKGLSLLYIYPEAQEPMPLYIQINNGDCILGHIAEHEANPWGVVYAQKLAGQ